MRVISLVCSIALAAHVSAVACSGTFGGKTFDLTSLISPTGSYVWTQDLYSTEGSLLYAPADYDKQHVTFEMQVCVPIGKSISANCTNPTSAVNMILPTGQCVSLGSGALWKLYQNPQNDGVYISYDEGDKVNHVQTYSSLVFFTCAQGGGAGKPVFEHQKTYFQNHFGFATAIVC